MSRKLQITLVLWIPLCVGCGLSVDPKMANEQGTQIECSGSGADQICYQIINGLAVTGGDMSMGSVEQVRAQYGDNPFPIGAADRSFFTTGTRNSWAGTYWPNGKIYYAIDPTLANPQRVTAALSLITNTCGSVSFIARTTQANYVYVTPDTTDPNTGYTEVGMVGGQQNMVMGDSMDVARFAHEFLHSVGLFHEHQRPDRDNYINVVQANVVPSFWATSFQKINLPVTTPYDVNSIMQYPSYAYAVNFSWTDPSTWSMSTVAAGAVPVSYNGSSWTTRPVSTDGIVPVTLQPTGMAGAPSAGDCAAVKQIVAAATVNPLSCTVTTATEAPNWRYFTVTAKGATGTVQVDATVPGQSFVLEFDGQTQNVAGTYVSLPSSDQGTFFAWRPYLPAGNYTFQAQMKDGAGNTASCSIAFAGG